MLTVVGQTKIFTVIFLYIVFFIDIRFIEFLILEILLNLLFRVCFIFR